MERLFAQIEHLCFVGHTHVPGIWTDDMTYRSPAELGYLYTLSGASVSFICRRNDLCVEVAVAHPAGRGVERRVNFSTLSIEDLTPERVTRIVTDAVKQIVRL
jgi:hypothetical protein